MSFDEPSATLQPRQLVTSYPSDYADKQLPPTPPSSPTRTREADTLSRDASRYISIQQSLNNHADPTTTSSKSISPTEKAFRNGQLKGIAVSSEHISALVSSPPLSPLSGVSPNANATFSKLAQELKPLVISRPNNSATLPTGQLTPGSPANSELMFPLSVGPTPPSSQASSRQASPSAPSRSLPGSAWRDAFKSAGR